MRSVLRLIIGLVIGLAAVAIAVAPVAAQEPVAEVRTWSGETLRLSQPSLEVFYTIPVKGEDTSPPDAAASAPPPMLFGSATALAGALEKKPEPMSGQRALTRGALDAVRPLARGFGVELGMTVDAVRAGLRVVEVPVTMEHAPTGRDIKGFVHRARQGFDHLLAALPRAVGLR